MNATFSKALRRKAQKETQGLPERDYEFHRNRRGLKGTTVVLTERCTRYVYRTMKKYVKKERRGLV